MWTALGAGRTGFLSQRSVRAFLEANFGPPFLIEEASQGTRSGFPNSATYRGALPGAPFFGASISMSCLPLHLHYKTGGGGGCAPQGTVGALPALGRAGLSRPLQAWSSAAWARISWPR